MSASAKYFGRYYRLQIIKDGDILDIQTKPDMPAMDIRFNVSYARGQVAREGTISILGLEYKKIHEIVKLAALTRGEAMAKQVRIKLAAGYFSSAGVVQIFDGLVWNATITAPPQMWLNMQVCEYNPMGNRTVQLASQGPTDIATLCRSILKSYQAVEGIQIFFRDMTEKQICGTEIGKPMEFKDALTLRGAIAHLNLNLSDKVLFVLRTDKGHTFLEAYDKSTALAAQGTVTVDKDHGLLSVSGIDCVNGTVTTFLDGQVSSDSLCHLQLRSELNQQANGTYYILRKQYVGHYMGNEWYTTYSCTAREKTQGKG